VGQTVIFGDVHGQADQLKEVIFMAQERFGTDLDLYTVGDLIDRGPDSSGVIELCIKYGVRGVYGNHDQWLHQFIQKRIFDPMCLHPVMGGSSTLSSYGVDWYTSLSKHPEDERLAHIEIANNLERLLPESHKDFVLSLKPFMNIEVDDKTYWLLHAGLKESIAKPFNIGKISDLDLLSAVTDGVGVNNILWPSPGLGRHDKDPINLHKFKDGRQILGHSICWYPQLNDFFCAIDTGCGTAYPWTLTALALPSLEIIQVERFNKTGR